MSARVDLGALPLWKGVQDAPGFESVPFVLETERGLIRLNRGSAAVAAVVERYGSSGYTFISTPPGHSSWGTRRAQWYLDTLAEGVGRLDDRTVLEIGSGTLFVADRVVTDLGAARVIACDPALRESGRARVDVVRDYFEYARFRDRRIDLVLSINNLEHVSDPARYLAEVRAVLEPTGGRFFIVVPECTRALRDGDWGLCVHEHLSYFTESSFRRLAAGTGFRVTRTWAAEDTLIALLDCRDVTPMAGGDEDVALEAAGRRFFDSLDAARRRLGALRERGARIGLHGCSAGLNNVLALLKLDTAEDVWLFDGDEAKAGKFLPAFDRPIEAAGGAAYRGMTNVVVAASTFFEPIRRFAIERGIPANRVHALTEAE